MIVNVVIPIEPFNSLVREGRAGDLIGKIFAEIKPETAYFTEQDGNRGILLVVEIPNEAAIPSIAEPFYLNFEAHCEFRIAMTVDDLMSANLAGIAEKWNEVEHV